MKKRIPDKFWFPWWPDKWIFGSVRIEFTPAERGMWVDMLSLASKDDGHIRANEETPYPLAQLAGMLIIPEEELDAAINKFIELGKLTKTKTGTLYVTKWEKYQFTDSHKRVLKHRSIKEDGTNEDALKAGIQEYLDNQKVSYETEKICKSGRIDIFFKTGKIPNDQEYIIEVKSNTSTDRITNGIRQLLEYKTEFPRAILYLAFPGELNEKMEEKLKMHNIEKWDCNAKCYNVTEGITNSIINKSTLNNNKLENNVELRKKIIDLFNETTNQKRSYTCDGTNKLINGRLSEGRTIDDFKHVIDTKYTQWRNDEKMSQFIRPSTLFRPENFENYLNEPYEDSKKKILKVGVSTHAPSKKEDDYDKARAIKMKELQEKYQPEIDKAKIAKSSDWMDEIDNKIKEEIAEFSRKYQSEEGK